MLLVEKTWSVTLSQNILLMIFLCLLKYEWNFLEVFQQVFLKSKTFTHNEYSFAESTKYAKGEGFSWKKPRLRLVYMLK